MGLGDVAGGVVCHVCAQRNRALRITSAAWAADNRIIVQDYGS
jgi:hypothetical protein